MFQFCLFVRSFVRFFCLCNGENPMMREREMVAKIVQIAVHCKDQDLILTVRKIQNSSLFLFFRFCSFFLLVFRCLHAVKPSKEKKDNPILRDSQKFKNRPSIENGSAIVMDSLRAIKCRQKKQSRFLLLLVFPSLASSYWYFVRSAA